MILWTRQRMLPALLALLAMTASSGCSMLQRPSARITGVKLREPGLTESTLLFDVEIQNPYSVDLPLGKADYTLASRGQQFLSGMADLAGSVPAGASRSVELPVTVKYIELIEAVKDARPGTKIPYTADMGLSVDAPALGPMRLPMRRSGELAIPSAPSLIEKLRGLPLK